MNEARVKRYLREFTFRPLFLEELGWERHAGSISLTVDGQSYSLNAVAEKRGMVAYVCGPQADGNVPDYKTRGRIEHEVTKTAREHLIVYTDANQSTQVWQWVRREPGRPAARREHTYYGHQSGEALVQKLRAVAFSLEEEEELTLVHVTTRARAAFDIERVTKRFYDRFKTEHTAFIGFIEGISAAADREWYASVMLNRLMFIYFIQKKRFLDDDPDYLRNRLLRVQRERGKDQFHTFYRYFLLRLCHEGLGTRPEERPADLDTLLGKVPYLNGGLFLPHPLEERHTDIQIQDEAFQRVFDFFDRYQWHLDERPLRNDNEINPDVLGYIFEKFINQKQMGAYYTKEDITEYISRNAIVPYLLTATRRDCEIAFQGDSSVWRLLSHDPDRYIFEALRHGSDHPMPPDIAAGLTDMGQRGGWNRSAPPEVALPTEIWREAISRHQHYQAVRGKLASGQVQSVKILISDSSHKMWSRTVKGQNWSVPSGRRWRPPAFWTLP